MVRCECGVEVSKLNSVTKKCEVCTEIELEHIRQRDVEDNFHELEIN